MKKLMYFTIIAAMMITACQPKSKKSSVDNQANADSIRMLEEQWSMAIKDKNVDKIVEFFAPDAVSMPANKPINVGLDAIRKAEEFSFSDTTSIFNTYSSTIDKIEVSVSGDLAYVRGSDRVSQITKKGPAEEVGNWIDIWKKVDGKWKVVVSIWTTDKPLPKN